MERWIEHWFGLYSKENTVSPAALDVIECLHHGWVRLRTIGRRTQQGLASCNAPDNGGIPPELIKHCKTTLLLPLHEVLCQCWQEGERNDCNNYRGISLLSIVGKVFARVILIRLKKLAERIYSESQCGFRAERSSIDMVFSIRQLQEKCREQQMPLCIAFIDLTEEFDLVNRDGLFKVLPKIGCPPKLQSMIESFHTDTKGTVQFNDSSSELFEINSSVKQSCVLVPTLFGICFGLLLKHAFDTTTEGIDLRTRSDGRLFNLARLRAKTKVRKVLIMDMLFADDAAVATHTQEEIQSLMECFSQPCKDFGLTISLKMTNVLGQDTEAPPLITIDDYEYDAVCQFTCLGSTITDNLSMDSGKAAISLTRLAARMWRSPKLSVKTNMAIYNACVTSTLLYGNETWSTYAGQERRLNTFHLRSIRRILGISWQDIVTSAYVLSSAGLPSMYTLLRQPRLRWLGHVRRMEDGRIPKDILYGELGLGRRTTGSPHLRY